MAVGAEGMLDLLRRLLDPSTQARGMAADSVCDWLTSYGDAEGRAVAQVLTWLAVVEADDSARESLLHALAELADHDLVASSVVEQVAAIPRKDLSGSSVEYYDYLVTDDDGPEES